MSKLVPNWVRLALNGTNLGLFKISFSTFWRGAQKCTETDLKSPRFIPFGGQSDPIWMPNLTSLVLCGCRDIRFRPKLFQLSTAVFSTFWVGEMETDH